MYGRRGPRYSILMQTQVGGGGGGNQTQDVKDFFVTIFLATFLQKFSFAEIFLAAANLFSDADTSGREADSGYERCRDCTDITLHRHPCHRRSTWFKLSDFLQENRDSFVFPHEVFSEICLLTHAVLLVPHARQASLRADVEQGWSRLWSETKSSASGSFGFLATFSLLIRVNAAFKNIYSEY